MANISKLLLFVLFLMFQIACSNSKVEEPKELIEEEKLVNVLSDVHLAEASIQSFTIHQRDSIAKQFYQHIFRIHKIEEDVFYQSLDYYSLQPKKLEELYQKVMDNLAKKEADIKKKK